MGNEKIYDELPERISNIFESCTKEEQTILIDILSELSASGESETYNKLWLADYKEIPVDIDTFLNADAYLGCTNRNGQAVYPFWRKELRNVFGAGNKYHEWILTGATRIGKTSTAIAATAYMLYRLMCLRDPQKFFGKKDISKFSILFFNITKDLAKGVAFREFNDTLKESPWFNAHGTFSKSERDFYYIPEGGKISIDYGSDSSHGLGKQVFCAVMDECNFSQAGIKDVQKAKAHMKETYNTVSARIKGTFKHGGEVFGKIFAVSSKRSDSDFMEAYVKEQLDAGAGDHMYISDAPQWEVLPPETFSTERFSIAVGGRHQKSFVIPDNQSFPEAIADLKSQGYMILNPPMDMKSDFLADFNVALRDLAGIAVVGAMSFITQESLNKCISKSRRNPFYSDILQIGIQSSYTIEEYFHIEEVPEEFKRTPIFIHLDLSLVTDRTGISGGGITGRKDISGEDGKKVSQPFLTHMFSVALEAPRGDKIPYSKIVAFICWLRRQGFNISGISRDQFQSEYLAQQLEAEGFTVDKLSLDRTPDGYIALRSVTLEERIDMLDSKLLQDELIHLQRDAVTGKVDHPVGGCFTEDTKIRLVDGRSLTIKELLIEQTYKTNYVYTINETTHCIEPKPIKRVFQTKITKELLKVTLDNGEYIYCTPEHRFMLRDGSYEEVQNLMVGTSLMPIYTKVSTKGLNGYRMYYEPYTEQWHYEHRSFCDNLIHTSDYVVHHCNYNKLNNTPHNLKCMTKSEHTKLHNNSTKDYSKISKGVKLWHKKMRGTGIYAKRSEACRNGTINYLKSINSDYIPNAEISGDKIRKIEEMFNIDWSLLSINEKNSYAVKYSRKINPLIQTRISKAISENHKYGKYKHAHEVVSQMCWITNGIDNKFVKKDCEFPNGYYLGRTFDVGAKISRCYQNLTDEEKEKRRKLASKATFGKIWINNGINEKYIIKGSDIPNGYSLGRLKHKKCKEYKNHKILNIESITMPCRVYDLEIVDNHNFALDAGVFVHNSKDLADSYAGWVWNALQHNLGIIIPAKTKVSVIKAVNGKRRPAGFDLPSMFSNLYKR